MVGADVAGDRRPDVAGHGQHRRMLARTVVVHRLRRAPGGDELLGRRTVRRRVGAAFERRRIETEAGEPAPNQVDMEWLAAMRGAGEGDLCLAHREMFGGAALQKGQRLQRLDRRPWKDGAVDFAAGVADGAGGVCHGESDPMPALDPLTPPHEDGDLVRRGVGCAHGGSSTTTLRAVKSSTSSPDCDRRWLQRELRRAEGARERRERAFIQRRDVISRQPGVIGCRRGRLHTLLLSN